jgi:hypothetical protein
MLIDIGVISVLIEIGVVSTLINIQYLSGRMNIQFLSVLIDRYESCILGFSRCLSNQTFRKCQSLQDRESFLSTVEIIIRVSNLIKIKLS